MQQMMVLLLVCLAGLLLKGLLFSLYYFMKFELNGTYLSRKMHIILVNSSLRGTKQSLADRHQALIDCRATARNDGDFGLSKCHSSLNPFPSHYQCSVITP